VTLPLALLYVALVVFVLVTTVALLLWLHGLRRPAPAPERLRAAVAVLEAEVGAALLPVVAGGVERVQSWQGDLNTS
jgi:hypothetical protein